MRAQGLLMALALAACSGDVGETPRDDPEAGAEAWFVDETVARGVDFVHRSGHGERFFFPELMGGGVALLDYDGDGLLDFLVQASAERLLQSAAGEDGLPTYGCEASPVVHDHWGSVFGGRGLVVDGAASGDLDGDGRSDLVISCRHRGAAFVAGLSLADRSTAIMRTPPPGPGHDLLAGSRYRFGYELLCPGDLNGDGAGDVIASGAITIFQVRVAALDAATGGELWSADWSDGGATSGVSLARFADVDGDGAREILVGSSDWFWHGIVVLNGTVRLLSGATGDPLWVVGERRYLPGGVESAPEARGER